MQIVLIAAQATDSPELTTLEALIQSAGLQVTFADRPPGAIGFLPCIAALDRTGVARACFGTGATVQDLQNAAAADDAPAAPRPNNPGNPYFGKTPKLTKDFWGHMLSVYIAIAPGGSATAKQAAGMSQLGRLLTSQTASPIVKAVEGANVVDPDDKNGDFLKMVGLLTSTNHEDAQLLMTPQELGAVMAAWT